MAKPKPVPKNVVCSECGLSWAEHTKDRKTDPTPDVCIRLLKAALAARPVLAYPQYTGISRNPLPSWSGVPLRGNDIGKAQ